MRILVCGSRDWTNKNKMEGVIFDIFQSGDTLIYGCCKGADRMSYNIVRKEFVTPIGDVAFNVLPFPAPWDDIEGKPDYQIGVRQDGKKYWKYAGPFRNQQMIDEGKPDIVLAFHNNIAKSKGTMDMIKRANAAGIEVRIYAEEKK